MQATTVLVTVAAAGTPETITTDTSIQVCGIKIQAWRGNASEIYLGLAGLNRGTGAAVIESLEAKERWEVGEQEGRNKILLHKFRIDAAANGAKALVTYWTA